MSKYIPFWAFRDRVIMTVYENIGGGITVEFSIGRWFRQYTTSKEAWDKRRVEECSYLEHLAHGDYTQEQS